MNSWRELVQRIWARATELVAMVVGVDRIQIDLTNSDSDSNHVSVRGANNVIVLSSGITRTLTHMYGSRNTLSHAYTKAENKMFTAKEYGVR